MREARSIIAVSLLIAACGSGAGEGPVLQVQVPPGAGFSQIADSLHQRGVVSSESAFKLYARFTGSDVRIRAGTYGFKKGQSWKDIISDLRSGRLLTAKVVVPEGFSIVRIVPRIVGMTGLDSAKIIERLSDPATPKKYNVPGPTMEGYLYPATYDLPVHASLDTVLAQMVRAYHRIWTPARQARADTLHMSEREVITFASIIEKEAKRREELPVIASVYHNRLRIGMPLGADPTVQYALGAHRERLLYSDLRKVEENPYNTYKIKGLPPGPIGSPSDVAIDATLHPDSTNFLYFVARPDGSHIFTRSLDEHNRAKMQSRRLREQTQTTPTAPPGAKK